MGALPPPTQEVARLVDLIGAEATLALVEARGGTRLYIARQSGQLAEVIGAEAAARLAAAYGANYLKVPVARNWRVLVYKAKGRSYAEIALRVRCSENTVWRVLAQHELTQQLDLFER